MRVPIPVVVLLVMMTVVGTWWGTTRRLDFITPPSEAKLAEIRVKFESTLPKPTEVAAAVVQPIIEPTPAPPPPQRSAEPPKPPIDLGDLTAKPALNDYGNLANKGAQHLIELATALEEKGEFQRCLLAWERVLDVTEPDESQAATAVSSIQRLRPTLPDWNTNPETAIAITLHVGMSKKQVKTMISILEDVAKVLETSSSGMVEVKTKVTAQKIKSEPSQPNPATVWISGPDKNSPSTEIVTMNIGSPETIRTEVLKTVFMVIRGHLGTATTYREPDDLMDGEDPQIAIDSRVTRLSWNAFAMSLNPQP